MAKYSLFIFLSICMICYLLYQSKEDIKDQTVPVLPNYLAIIITFFLYLLGCLFTWSIPDYKTILLLIIVLIIMSLLQIFGSGDAKAFLAIGLLSSFTVQNNQIFHAYLDLSLLALTYIFATIVFIPINIKKGRKEGRTWKDLLFGKRTVAYFPYITIGYILASTSFVLIHFI